MTSELITKQQLLRRVRMKMFDFSRIAHRAVTKELGREPICKAGCAWCCYAKILIDGGTGAIIALYLQQTGQWTPALVEKLRAADRVMAPVSHAEWLQRKTPCVFLKETSPGRGRCTIHPVRPLACAAAHGRTTEPADCALPSKSNLAMVMPSPEGMQRLLQEPEGLLNAAGETELMVMTIPAAVLYGQSMLQGEPRPDTARVSKDTWERDVSGSGVLLETYFDEAAVAAAATPGGTK